MSVKKMNLRSFKLNRVYLDPLNLSNWQATFPGVEFLRISFRFKKRKEKFVVVCPFLIKRQTRRFHVVVVQWTSKKCTKKRDSCAELLF